MVRWFEKFTLSRLAFREQKQLDDPPEISKRRIPLVSSLSQFYRLFVPDLRASSAIKCTRKLYITWFHSSGLFERQLIGVAGSMGHSGQRLNTQTGTPTGIVKGNTLRKCAVTVECSHKREWFSSCPSGSNIPNTFQSIILCGRDLTAGKSIVQAMQPKMMFRLKPPGLKTMLESSI